MIPAKLSSPRTGSVTLLSFDGKQFKLQSPDAFAPGQPLIVTVSLASEHVLDLKSLGSVRREDGFEVRARAQTMRRETREALLAHFSR
jgi:hypothetical protein